MSNTAVIMIATGERITIDDVHTSRPLKTLELLVATKRAVWEGQPIEVSPTDAISIIERERVKIVDEREKFEQEKAKLYAEIEEMKKKTKGSKNHSNKRAT